MAIILIGLAIAAAAVAVLLDGIRRIGRDEHHLH